MPHAPTPRGPIIRRFTLLETHLALATFTLSVACGGSEPVRPKTRSTEATDARPASSAADELAHLAALGYANYAEDEVEDTRGGVVVHDRERSSPGYSLYTSLPHGVCVLIDAAGDVVNSWQLAEGRVAERCELLPDGDVLIVSVPLGAEEQSAGWCLERWSWEGERLWLRDLGAHHDVDPLANGEIAVLTSRNRLLPAIHATVPVRDDVVTILSADGGFVREHSLWDMLAGNPRLVARCKRNFFAIHPEESWKGFIDLFHANSLEWIQRPDLAHDPLYAPTNVLLSLRAQDSVVIFDTVKQRKVWIFGIQVQGPHEASLLPNGNVLLFDNGCRGRGHSRIVEIDPKASEIVWEYAAPSPEDFFSSTRGTVQYLASDTFLVANSIAGEAFEVDRAGRVVWRFLNPHTDGQGRRGAIRIERYAREMVDALRGDR